MKRILFCLLILTAAMSLSAAPTVNLTWMDNGAWKFADGEDFRGYADYQSSIIAKFEATHPGYKVTNLHRDVKQGSLTVDALMAAGTPPDVWFDASSYFPKYMNDTYALPLQKYGNTSVYFKNLLDLYTFNGNVYGLPVSNIAGGFAINLDMLKDIGYTMPAQTAWTTDEFLALGAKLKAKGYPLTAIQLKGGMNSWTNVFLYSFGASFYNGKDISKTTINSPAAIAGLAYIKKMADLGYSPPPLETDDDGAVELFTTGQVFSSMMQNGHSDYWIPEQLRQGKISKLINVDFVEAPHAPGVAHTPVFGYQSIVVAHKSTSEVRNKAVADLAFAIAGKEAGWFMCTVSGGFPTLKDWAPGIGTAASPTYKAINALAPVAGLQPTGPLGDKAAEVRRLWNTLSEQWFRGQITAQAFLSQYEAQANAVLK